LLLSPDPVFPLLMKKYDYNILISLLELPSKVKFFIHSLLIFEEIKL